MHRSIANYSEAEIVDKLLDVPKWSNDLLNVDGVPLRPTCLRRVALKPISDQQGDVDILIANANRPEEAVAIDVKRVKIDADGLERGKANRLSQLRKGARQANQLAELGFARVFYLTIILIDSRLRNEGRSGFTGWQSCGTQSLHMRRQATPELQSGRITEFVRNTLAEASSIES